MLRGSWLQDTQAHCKEGFVSLSPPPLPPSPFCSSTLGPLLPCSHLRRTHDRLLLVTRRDLPPAAAAAAPGSIVHLRANDVEKQQVHGHSGAGLSSAAVLCKQLLRQHQVPPVGGVRADRLPVSGSQAVWGLGPTEGMFPKSFQGHLPAKLSSTPQQQPGHITFLLLLRLHGHLSAAGKPTRAGQPPALRATAAASEQAF